MWYIHVEDGGKLAQNGLEMRPLDLFEHTKRPMITDPKTRFSPILDAFLVPKRPVSRHFGIGPGPKRANTG